jgi:hypothetical protein
MLIYIFVVYVNYYIYVVLYSWIPIGIHRNLATGCEGGSASFVRTLVARLTLPRPLHPAPYVREESRNAPLSGTGCEKF